FRRVLFRSLHSDRISPRYHRQIVSTVRSDNCDLGRLLRVQRALAQPGTFRAVTAPAQENPRAARLVLRTIQSRFRQRRPRVCKLVAGSDSENGAEFRTAARSCDWRRFFWEKVAEQLFARGRSGLRLSRASIAGRLIARAHRSSLP